MEALGDAQRRQPYNNDFSLNSHAVIRGMEVGGCNATVKLVQKIYRKPVNSDRTLHKAELKQNL